MQPAPWSRAQCLVGVLWDLQQAGCCHHRLPMRARSQSLCVAQCVQSGPLSIYWSGEMLQTLQQHPMKLWPDVNGLCACCQAGGPEAGSCSSMLGSGAIVHACSTVFRLDGHLSEPAAALYSSPRLMSTVLKMLSLSVLQPRPAHKSAC